MPGNDDCMQRTGGVTRRGLLQAAGGACLCALAASPAASAASDRAAQSARKGLLRFRRSPWFDDLGGGRLQCTLCPRACRIPAGRRGMCRVRGNHEGRGYTLVYGNPAVVQIDPIERQPFYHVLPASRSLSVATAGCNVSCKFCEVWDMALVAPEDIYAYDFAPDRVVQHALESDVRSVAFAWGEPVVFFEYMLDAARLARQAGLRTLVHTNGYVERRPLEVLCDAVDAFNVDLKAFDEEFYRTVVGGELRPVLDTLRRLHEAGLHTEVTNLLIPTLNDDSNTLRAMCVWIREELGPETPLHLNRFYPLYRLSNLPPTPMSTLNEARRIARDVGLKHVYIGNVMGHEGQHTYCAGCGEEIIHRVGFMTDEPRLKQGRCALCGHALSGIFS